MAEIFLFLFVLRGLILFLTNKKQGDGTRVYFMKEREWGKRQKVKHGQARTPDSSLFAEISCSLVNDSEGFGALHSHARYDCVRHAECDLHGLSQPPMTCRHDCPRIQGYTPHSSTVLPFPALSFPSPLSPFSPSISLLLPHTPSFSALRSCRK